MANTRIQDVIQLATFYGYAHFPHDP